MHATQEEIAVLNKVRTYKTPIQDKIERLGVKWCGKCEKDKPVGEFAKRKRVPCGYASWCKMCSRQYDADNRLRFRRAKINRYYLTTYGRTLEEFEAVVLSQNNCCAICGQFMKEPHWDHDHETGICRGALCHKCNVGLGHFNDNFDLLLKAANYLGDYNGKASTPSSIGGTDCRTAASS
jgi:hypothetical protein